MQQPFTKDAVSLEEARVLLRQEIAKTKPLMLDIQAQIDELQRKLAKLKKRDVELSNGLASIPQLIQTDAVQEQVPLSGASKQRLPMPLIHEILQMNGEGHLYWILSKRLRDSKSVKREVVVPITRISLKDVTDAEVQFMTYNRLFHKAAITNCRLSEIRLRENHYSIDVDQKGGGCHGYFYFSLTYDMVIKNSPAQTKTEGPRLNYTKKTIYDSATYTDLHEPNTEDVEEECSKFFKGVVAYNCHGLTPSDYDGFRCFVFDGVPDRNWQKFLKNGYCSDKGKRLPAFTLFNLKTFNYFTRHKIRITPRECPLSYGHIRLQAPLLSHVAGNERDCIYDPLTKRVFAQATSIIQAEFDLGSDLKVRQKYTPPLVSGLDPEVYTHALDQPTDCPLTLNTYQTLTLKPETDPVAIYPCGRCEKVFGLFNRSPKEAFICAQCLMQSLEAHRIHCECILLTPISDQETSARIAIAAEVAELRRIFFTRVYCICDEEVITTEIGPRHWVKHLRLQAKYKIKVDWDDQILLADSFNQQGHLFKDVIWLLVFFANCQCEPEYQPRFDPNDLERAAKDTAKAIRSLLWPDKINSHNQQDLADIKTETVNSRIAQTSNSTRFVDRIVLVVLQMLRLGIVTRGTCRNDFLYAALTKGGDQSPVSYTLRPELESPGARKRGLIIPLSNLAE